MAWMSCTILVAAKLLHFSTSAHQSATSCKGAPCDPSDQCSWCLDGWRSRCIACESACSTHACWSRVRADSDSERALAFLVTNSARYIDGLQRALESLPPLLREGNDIILFHAGTNAHAHGAAHGAARHSMARHGVARRSTARAHTHMHARAQT